jgi:fructokinase
MKIDGDILCFGEIVWDALPEGIFLGGAPLNVAYHLNQLGRRAFPVSRIGKDFLGAQTLRNLKRAGVSEELIQTDETYHTGAVVVSLSESGDASYEILQPAAWDFIQATDALMEHASRAGGLVYGSLATRSEHNAKLLAELIDLVPFSVCDVNLRKPFDNPENALKWASKASLVKLNDEELDQLSPESSGSRLEDKAAALAARIGVKTLVVTRGGEGAYVFHEGKGHGRPAPKVEVADTVGAGDAFTAAFISTFMDNGDVAAALDKALRLGAFVAGQRGAQPTYDPADVLG